MAIHNFNHTYEPIRLPFAIERKNAQRVESLLLLLNLILTSVSPVTFAVYNKHVDTTEAYRAIVFSLISLLYFLLSWAFL